MKYLVVFYSVILMVSTFIGYKKKLGTSLLSFFIGLLLWVTSFINLFFSNSFLRVWIAIFLIIISVSFFIDRTKSGKIINYSHHFIRLIIHLIMIYYLLV